MNAYSTSYTFIQFELPQDTKEACAAARKFIKLIKSNLGCWSLVVSRGKGSGLIMMDFAKATEELQAALPPDASLRLIGVTDKQVSKGQNFWGQMRTSPAAK